MHLKRLEGPQLEPLSLAEVKQHLRISHDADDASLRASLSASRQAIENFLEISVLSQKWEFRETIYGLSRVELPHGPVISVTDMKLNKKPLALDKYSLIQEGTRSYVHDLDYLFGDLCIRYDAGFGRQADSVPSDIKQAMLILVTYFYENRGEDDMPIPTQIKELLQPYRRYRV